jgi:hypothetical protein
VAAVEAQRIAFHARCSGRVSVGATTHRCRLVDDLDVEALDEETRRFRSMGGQRAVAKVFAHAEFRRSHRIR